ncbi:MAG: hypothetical protein HRU29_10315 [Rhizobiales bacterium]|nr:hypothetical protein [Hyphomicrobiales bacterium]NRB14784.1 hypothetical protein [Hyphomicrobiales bacterium]
MNITAEKAIIKKELLEHKTSLFIAPAILTSLFFVLISIQMFFGTEGVPLVPAHEMFVAAYVMSTVFFVIYMVITLFFYFADSFSSDRKHNGLLFWKSLPISDLKILGLKTFTGTIIIPLIILGWIMVASVSSYIIGLLNFGGFTQFIAPWTALYTLVELSANLLIILVIVFLWLAPFYTWVGVLSAFFKKWSIALAFVIPLVLIAMEEIFSFDAFQTSYIADFIGNRLVGIVDHSVAGNAEFNQTMQDMSVKMNFGDDGPNNLQGFEANLLLSKLETITWHFITNVRWLALLSGLLVSGVFVYIASEYRRRFIEA